MMNADPLRLLGAPDFDSAGVFLRGPCVYAFFDQAGSVIYIGSSERGVERPLSSGHRAWSQASFFRLWHCKSPAINLERDLILACRPRLNRNVPLPNGQAIRIDSYRALIGRPKAICG